MFIECWKEGLYIHAFTHDLSKFLPREFFPYANYDFKGNNSDKSKQKFDKAWQHHKDNNKHHWNYWSERNLAMPTKYILQMICDWRAMSRKFGGSAEKYYLENYNKIQLEFNSRLYLEFYLGLNESLIHNCGNTIKGFYEEQKDEWFCRNFIWINEAYEVDIKECVSK